MQTPWRYRAGWAMVVAVVCAWAGPLRGQDAPPASGEEESPERTYVIAPADKLPEGLQGQYVGDLYRNLGNMVKAVPKGHRLEVVITKFMNPNYGTMDDTILSAVPVNAKGERDGIYQQFDTARRGPIVEIPYVAGVKEGEERQFGVDRREQPFVRKVVPWVKGEVRGTVKMFHETGEVMSEIPYVKGRPHGPSKSYAADGTVVSEVTYKDGLMEGVKKDYWPKTKQVKRVIPYRQGKVHGDVKEYYQTGKLRKEMQFWEDMLHGVEKSYAEDGTLEDTRYYVSDERVTEGVFKATYKVPPPQAPDDKAATNKR